MRLAQYKRKHWGQWRGEYRNLVHNKMILYFGNVNEWQGVYISSKELATEALWWEWSTALAWTDLGVIIVLGKFGENLTSLDEVNFGPQLLGGVWATMQVAKCNWKSSCSQICLLYFRNDNILISYFPTIVSLFFTLKFLKWMVMPILVRVFQSNRTNSYRM